MTEKNTIPQAYWENSRWAREHATELYQQYNKDVWIAIADQHVVAVRNGCRQCEENCRSQDRATNGRNRSQIHRKWDKGLWRESGLNLGRNK